MGYPTRDVRVAAAAGPVRKIVGRMVADERTHL